jgi:hypothetical protein
MKCKFPKIIYFVICLLLIFQQSGFAQVAAELNIAGQLMILHNSLTVDKFRPLHLRYLSYDPSQNNFRLLLDKGDLKNPRADELENASKELLKYFFIGLALPNDAFWVNLRPDSPDNIIDDYLLQTDIGRIMLATDLQLKKDTALATSPETREGREYWDKLYRKAGELFGSENVTIPTLTRPWIVPDEIIVRETADSAYVYKATLKVMLEQDYLKNDATYSFKDDRLKQLNEYSSQLIRELIIPKLNKEINTSKKYAQLRQVYYSLILAQWFKARYSGKNTTYSNLINRKNLTNLISKDNWSKTTYFQQYQRSFKDGEYNLKEPVYTPYGQVIRSYFSGGMQFGKIIDPAQVGPFGSSPIAGSPVQLTPALVNSPLPANSNTMPVVISGSNQNNLVMITGDENEVATPASDRGSSPVTTTQGVDYGTEAWHQQLKTQLEDGGYNNNVFNRLIRKTKFLKIDSLLRRVSFYDDVDRILFLINGSSDSQRAAELWTDLAHKLEAAGYDHSLQLRLIEALCRKFIIRGPEVYKSADKLRQMLDAFYSENGLDKIKKLEKRLIDLEQADGGRRYSSVDTVIGRLVYNSESISAAADALLELTNRLDTLPYIREYKAAYRFIEKLINYSRDPARIAKSLLQLTRGFKLFSDIHGTFSDFIKDDPNFEEGLLSLSQIIDSLRKAGLADDEIEKFLIKSTIVSYGRAQSIIRSMEPLKDSNEASDFVSAISALRELIGSNQFVGISESNLKRLATDAQFRKISAISLRLWKNTRDDRISKIFRKWLVFFYSGAIKRLPEDLWLQSLLKLAEGGQEASVGDYLFSLPNIVLDFYLKSDSAENKVETLYLFKRILLYFYPPSGDRYVDLESDAAKIARIIRNSPNFSQKEDFLIRLLSEKEADRDNPEIVLRAIVRGLGSARANLVSLLDYYRSQSLYLNVDFRNMVNEFLSSLSPEQIAELRACGGPAFEEMIDYIASKQWVPDSVQIEAAEELLKISGDREEKFLLEFLAQAMGSYHASLDGPLANAWPLFSRIIRHPEISKEIKENLAYKFPNNCAIALVSQPGALSTVLCDSTLPISIRRIVLTKSLSRVKEWTSDFLIIIKSNPELNKEFLDLLQGAPGLFFEHEKAILEVFNPAIIEHYGDIENIFSKIAIPPFIIQYFLNGLLNDAIKNSKGEMDIFVMEILNNKELENKSFMREFLDYLVASDFKFTEAHFNVLLGSFEKYAHNPGIAGPIADTIFTCYSKRSSETPSSLELTKALKAVRSGGMDVKRTTHILANYIDLKTKLNQSLANERITYENFYSIIQNGGKGLESEDIPAQDKLNIRGLDVEAFIMREKILESAGQARKLGRKIVVIGNLSYGGVALTPITEERNGGTYVVGTDIPVWYTKVGSSESHNNEFVLPENLLGPEQLRLLVTDNPFVIVVDGSTSVADPTRTSAHIPDGFKGYRNFFIVLNQALYGSINPLEFYEDEEFVRGLLDTPSAKELIARIQGMSIKPRAPNSAYIFRFWYKRDADPASSKEEFLYLRVNKKKDTPAPKAVISEMNSPSCIFIQSAVHPQDIDPRIKKEFIGGDHTPAYFDDKDHFKEFYLDYEEGYGVVLSKRYAYLARQLFREFMRSQGRALEMRTATAGKICPIETVVLDLDGTLVITDGALNNGTAGMINNLEGDNKRVVIITEDIEANVDRRLARVRKSPNLVIFSDSGTKGYTYTPAGDKLYFDNYNAKSRIDAATREKIIGIISAHLAPGTWQIDSRAERISDNRLDLFNVTDRTHFVTTVQKLLSDAGISAKVYKVGRTSVKIVLQHKEDALRFFVEHAQIERGKVLVVGDSAHSFGVDRGLLTALPEGINVNVGEYSPTISRENPNIVQHDRGGIDATLKLLSNIEVSGGLPENLIVPSEKGQPFDSDEAEMKQAASPVETVSGQAKVWWTTPPEKISRIDSRTRNFRLIIHGLTTEAQRSGTAGMFNEGDVDFFDQYLSKGSGEKVLLFTSMIAPQRREFGGGGAVGLAMEVGDDSAVIDASSGDMGRHPKRDGMFPLEFVQEKLDKKQQQGLATPERVLAKTDSWPWNEVELWGRVGVGNDAAADIRIKGVVLTPGLLDALPRLKEDMQELYERAVKFALRWNLPITYLARNVSEERQLPRLQAATEELFRKLKPTTTEAVTPMTSVAPGSVNSPADKQPESTSSSPAASSDSRSNYPLHNDGEVFIEGDTVKIVREGREFRFRMEHIKDGVTSREGLMFTGIGEGASADAKLMIYSLPLGGRDNERGLNGVWIDPGLSDQGVLRPLLNVFFHEFLDVRQTFPKARNIVLQDFLIRDYGFAPEAGVAPTARFRFAPKVLPSGRRFQVFFIDKTQEADFRSWEGSEEYEIVDPENFSENELQSFRPVYYGHSLVVTDEAHFQRARELIPIKNSAIDARPSAASPAISEKKTGGIDFRSLPIVTQAMSNLTLNTSRIPLGRLDSINLDKEWQDIQRLVEAGITPSAERIKEFVQVSCLRGSSDEDMQKVVSCIADILRLEEERCCSTEQVLKDILVVLESGSSIQELKAVFTDSQS